MKSFQLLLGICFPSVALRGDRVAGKLATRPLQIAVSPLEIATSSRVNHFGLADIRSSVASNSGSTMVWSRSGPVEIIPIFAPDSASRNFKYSFAADGRASKVRTF